MTVRSVNSRRTVFAMLSLAFLFQAALDGPAMAAGGPCGGCFAVVRGDGVVLRGFPSAITVRKRGTGKYEVNFDTGGVDGCAYTVAINNGGKFGSAPGAITAGRSASSTVYNVVTVATFNVAGKPADRGFHLVITC